MDFSAILSNPYTVPVIAFLSGLLGGWIFEKIVYNRLLAFAKSTEWEFDDVIIESVKGVTFFWFVLLGTHVALESSVLSDRVTHITSRILLVVWILSITVVVARMIIGVIDVYAKKNAGVLSSASLFRNMTKIVVFIIGFLIVLQSLGISITPILTALGVGGLAVALALQDTLSNLFAGMNILIAKQIKPGDYVRLESGQEGTITDINWRNTTITQLGDDNVVIPNSKLSSIIIINFQTPVADTSVLVPVGVDYGSDLEKVEAVTVEVAKEVMQEVDGALRGFQPFVRYNAFADSSVNFNVIMRVTEFKNRFLLTHMFIKRLHARYKREGIQIPFPTRSVFIQK